MAAERWRKTERMQTALDAYTSEFGLSPRPAYGHPSPHEEALAAEFAKQLYEINQQTIELQERYRAIREWQYRYHHRYPTVPVTIYQPPPEEPKPKIVKPNYNAEVFGSNAILGEVILTQKELAKGDYTVENEHITTYGSAIPEYLVQPNTLKLDGKPIGTVTDLKQHVGGGIEVKAQITDPAFYDKLTKGWSAGPKASSLTVDEVKKAYDHVKGALTGDFDAYKVIFIGTKWSDNDIYNKIEGKKINPLYEWPKIVSKKKNGK